ncbi:MAG: ferritin [Chlorobiaceae bacterium]|nr:ferritin [Chlorobiaceae bacterium]
MEKKKEFIKGLKQAWRDEMLSALNYRALAEREKDTQKKGILIRMAEAEERHAETWAKRLRDLGVETGKFKMTLFEQLRQTVILKSDTTSAAQMLEAGESEADKLYTTLMDAAQTEQDRASLLEAQKEEHAHSKMLKEFETAPIHPQSRLETILGREKWHVRAGGWIGQAIYGANDGLGAVFGIVSGMAGYAGGSDLVLVAGLAGSLASALSMGSGAYLAGKAEKEVYQAEIERERKEIEENPEEEIEELALFYQLKGFTEDEANALARKLIQQPEHMLKILVSEELGLAEATFPNPVKEAFSSGISTAIGGMIPVIPFFFTSGMTAVVVSLLISTLAHFAIGVLKTIVTGRSWIKSGAEMTAVGIITAALAYGLGMLLSPGGHIIP